MSMTEPLIRVKDLEKIYGGKSVLKSISLDIFEGDTVVLIGPSGTGKSTLLRCLNLLTKPDGGEIWFDGDNITAPGVNEDQVRTHMGMVFQDFLLFNHLSALNNVAIGLTKVLGMEKEAARNKAMQELAFVGLEDHADKYPGQLSGGQKQRVAIARALAMDPRVMLFDEPTSALDPELIGEVLTTMERLSNDGMTMVCVTHEMGFAREVADKIVFMEGGIVVEEGPPAQMFTAPQIPRTREFLWKITELYGDHD
jgi:polar amino acid transport system ATP-binding protein